MKIQLLAAEVVPAIFSMGTLVFLRFRCTQCALWAIFGSVKSIAGFLTERQLLVVGFLTCQLQNLSNSTCIFIEIIFIACIWKWKDRGGDVGDYVLQDEDYK